jgi:hypothetical protein
MSGSLFIVDKGINCENKKRAEAGYYYHVNNICITYYIFVFYKKLKEQINVFKGNDKERIP